MRNKFWYSWLIPLLLAAVVQMAVYAVNDSGGGLSLESPTSCPSTGCAAGQRLNFMVDFSVDPQFTSGANTQVCLYAPEDGVSGAGVESWADFSQGWITENSTYTRGQVNSICTNAAPTGDEYLAGVYAAHTSPRQSQIKFALHVNRTTDTNGHVIVKVLQVDSAGKNWVETSAPSSAFTVQIPVAALEQTVYTAETPGNCSSFKPCFVHSGDDKDGGQGTGLYDAIQALDPGGEIYILKDLWVKDHAIIVNKNIAIKGYDQDSMLTSINSEDACKNRNALLVFQSGGSLQDLTINDGNCSTSRTLVEIDSSSKVIIHHNTLKSGDYAIYVHDEKGTVEIIFNEIANNQENAVFIEAGLTNIDRVNIYGNNIVNNGNDIQVVCNSQAMANHNFWGKGQLPAENTSDCMAENGKELGAPILPAANGHGVQAILAAVTDEIKYYDAFNGKIGAEHTEGNDYNIVIVNHGQGKIENIPFYETGSGDILPCGNFYDIFLAPDANPKSLKLALKYDLNEQCINSIESEYYCGNTNSSRYPLWWYDPMTDATEGWDRTGQDPQGVGGGASGQVTTCNPQKDEIIVAIDTSGQPGLLSDLNFTPFTTGYIDGAALTHFSAEFINFYSRVTWTTSRERNIKRYELLRSLKQTSGFEIINTVNVTSDSATPNTYQFYDYDVKLSTQYFYKLRVIHDSESNEVIGLHGPVALNVPAPTITSTPTITRTPVPTSTPVYRTPTRPIYRSPTPGGTPTQVRTYGPTATVGAKPPFEPSPTGTITLAADTGYPAGEEGTPTQTGSPESADQPPFPTEAADGGQETETEPRTAPTNDESNGNTGNGETRQSAPRAMHLIIGAATGLTLLLVASIFIAKILFQVQAR